MTTVEQKPDDPAQEAPKTAELAIPKQATDEVVGIVLDAHAARVLTDGIRHQLTTAYDGVIAAYHGRAWIALGYDSWDAYCKAEFKDVGMVRLDPNQRREVVAEMREAGMSTRAISSGLGISQSTVNRDASTESNDSVEPATVMSLDGRGRPAKRSPQDRPAAEPEPLPEKANNAVGENVAPQPDPQAMRAAILLDDDVFEVALAAVNERREKSKRAHASNAAHLPPKPPRREGPMRLLILLGETADAMSHGTKIAQEMGGRLTEDARYEATGRVQCIRAACDMLDSLITEGGVTDEALDEWLDDQPGGHQ